MNTIAGTPEIIFPNLGIVINHLSRVAFTVFGYEIYWYGIFIGLGLLLGIFAAIREAKRTGQDVNDFYDFVIYAIIFSMIGARLYYVIFSWDSYKGDLLSIFNLRKGGLAIYGTVIAAVITATVYTRVRKISFLRFADAGIFGLILGQIAGRWGNFFNREAFGGYTDSLFAMQYLKNTVEYSNITQDILNNMVIINGMEYIQVHPTFLYEMLWNIGVLIIMHIYKRHKRFDGEMLLIYFIGYGIGRFWIEGLRTDQLIFFNTNIAVSQLVSAILTITAICIWIYTIKKNKKPAISEETQTQEAE